MGLPVVKRCAIREETRETEETGHTVLYKMLKQNDGLTILFFGDASD